MDVKVYNKKFPFPKEAVYVGRPTKWGNPFTIGVDGDREEVIKKYKEWFPKQKDLKDSLVELKQKDLLCWCAPKPCHADFLLKLANQEE